jgi:hypothetical protein
MQLSAIRCFRKKGPVGCTLPAAKGGMSASALIAATTGIGIDDPLRLQQKK